MVWGIFKKPKTEMEEIEALRKKVYGEKEYKEEMEFDKHADKNLTGIELEKAGKIDEAIILYEQNVEENFIGSHPYNRLAIIYRKKGQIDEEIRVLEKAVWVFEKKVDKSRADRLPKLEKFKSRLDKAKALKGK